MSYAAHGACQHGNPTVLTPGSFDPAAGFVPAAGGAWTQETTSGDCAACGDRGQVLALFSTTLVAPNVGAPAPVAPAFVPCACGLAVGHAEKCLGSQPLKRPTVTLRRGGETWYRLLPDKRSLGEPIVCNDADPFLLGRAGQRGDVVHVELEVDAFPGATEVIFEPDKWGAHPMTMWAPGATPVTSADSHRRNLCTLLDEVHADVGRETFYEDHWTNPAGTKDEDGEEIGRAARCGFHFKVIAVEPAPGWKGGAS
jgi:hypothetical protein